MHKIPTIFDRDWDGNRGVVPRWSEDFLELLRGGDPEFALMLATATEKLDGTNVRVTVRSGRCVRVEARVNPSKQQKSEGISEPWYRDASGPQDRYVIEAVESRVFSGMADGEWPAEAIGPKIQGNPLGLEEHRIVVFSEPSVRRTLHLATTPRSFEQLRDWLPQQRSMLNPDAPIEGVVWHLDAGMAKLKTVDFK
jgi:hypothetical protein